MKQPSLFSVTPQLETRRLAEKILKKTNYAGMTYLELGMISNEQFKPEWSYFYNKRFKNRTITPPIELIKKLDIFVRENKEAKEELLLFCKENREKGILASRTSNSVRGIKPKSTNKIPTTIQENEEEYDSSEEVNSNQTNKYSQILQHMVFDSSELSLSRKQSSSTTEIPKQHWFFTWCSWLCCCSPCLGREQSNEVVLQSNETTNTTSLKNTF